MPSAILILLCSIIAGGFIGWARHRSKRKRRDLRIHTEHGKNSEKMVMDDGALIVGTEYWQPPRMSGEVYDILKPQEATYLILWFKDMGSSSNSIIRRGIKNNGWLTLPIPLNDGAITEARRLDGKTHRWALGAPGTPLSAMRWMTEIGTDVWVLDEKAQYSLELNPLQCMVEFGTDRMLWLPIDTSDSFDTTMDDEGSHSSQQNTGRTDH